ncbi:MAG TPA: cyclopropane-fatty-acyl-phospholipid synthase family protein [Sphingomonas sp.]|nr:cyclopropane-fatty-acyl-phospholipid synthase family protein [Sphingomonas sp.]
MVAPIGDRVLERIDRGLAQGSIDATLPGGEERIIGGRAPGPRAVVHLVRWRALRRLAAGGSASWYEAWAAGDWTSPDPVVLFELFMLNRRTLGSVARARGVSKLVRRAWHWLRRNHRAGAKRNIAAHYDLGNDFYREWLDPSLTYSSALFAEPISPGQSLQAAQEAKLAAILDRTGAKSGDTILEIGCGWGSFAAAASAAGAQVHGITLSEEQKAFVDARDLPGVTVSLTDYRDVTGRYDAVASIEMVEAVGEEFWPAYLRVVATALKPGGRAAIQLISIDDAIFDAYASSVDFIQRYIFPGGMLISESRFRAIAERAGLVWRDRHGFGLYYAETLLRWRSAFDQAVAERRLPARFDADFVAMWRYYLMYCEGGFRGGGIDVVQVTLIKEG